MKRLRCRDVGFDCNHEIHAETDQEILQQAAEHVQSVHSLEVTSELADQVKKLIQDED
jgi:predicted small metal-binding protein